MCVRVLLPYHSPKSCFVNLRSENDLFSKIHITFALSEAECPHRRLEGQLEAGAERFRILTGESGEDGRASQKFPERNGAEREVTEATKAKECC